MINFVKLTTCCFVFIFVLDTVNCEKFKLCVVDGKGTFKKSHRYCPALDISQDSTVECVVAPDRTACLRQILKGKADFSVFSPEDLVTANNENIEILVTNEIRYTEGSYEYEVVAVVDKKSGIRSRHDIKGKRYCHPGYGYETDWTRILANYFEASIVTPSCDSIITLVENRIKASAKFFRSACKAGPWVNDIKLDLQLKRKYPHLCKLCGDPNKCSMQDQYWGRRGSLLCLTDGAGDISWARLDDVQPHFGLVKGLSEASAEDYDFLCPDDTLMPLNSSKPCVWVVKPWPVVAARRAVADDIQKIVSSLTHSAENTWRNSLLLLLETSYSTIYKLPTLQPIETYLDQAVGFLSANSFTGCHPPRTVKICTTSIKESAKCSWLRESAAVYGIEPDLECIKADNTTHCMLALNLNAADIVMVPPNLLHTAERDYNLKTLFYETANDDEKYLTVAVTRTGSGISSFSELRGKKACFPTYDGVAWNTVKDLLYSKKLIEYCPLDKSMIDFFGPSCIPGMNDSNSMNKNCQDDTFSEDFRALHCLTSEVGDVAFVSYNSIRKYVQETENGNIGHRLTIKDFEVLCEKSDSCYISWAPLGQAMIRGNATELWKKDTLDIFLQLDQLFGKTYKSLTNAFTLFGTYEGTSDLLFHDETLRLRVVPDYKDTNTNTPLFKTSTKYDNKCTVSSSANSRYWTNIIMCMFSIYTVRLFVRTYVCVF